VLRHEFSGVDVHGSSDVQGVAAWSREHLWLATWSGRCEG
jgi:hypothetical protein